MQSFSLDKATEILENEGREAQFAYCMQYADGDQKDPDALACVGHYYHYADQLKDLEKAEVFYKEAALNGSELGKEGIFELACHYFHVMPSHDGSPLIEKLDLDLNPDKAYELFIFYDRLGNTAFSDKIATIFVWLGEAYEFGGYGIKENKRKALECYKLAADKGSKQGLHRYTGYLDYLNASSIKSHEIIQLASIDTTLTFDRYNLHRKNRGISCSFESRLIQFVLFTIVLGIIECVFSYVFPEWEDLIFLGYVAVILFSMATLIPVMFYDSKKRNEIQKQTADEAIASVDDPEILYALAESIYFQSGNRKNMSKTIMLYEKAARLGSSAAKVRLGEMYLFGKGVLIDFDKAFALYKEAAETGDCNGQYMVGCCFEKGLGVVQSLPDADIWYQRAKENGSRSAKRRLSRPMRLGGIDKKAGEVGVRAAYEDVRRQLEIKDRQLESKSRQLEIKDKEILEMLSSHNAILWGIAGDVGVIKSNLNIISAQIEGAKQDLKHAVERESETLAQSIDNASEKLINQFVTYCENVNKAVISEATAESNKSIYTKEEELLEKKFGDVWNRLQDDSRISLISARTLYALTKNSSLAGRFDYSGIAISASSALENELSKQFFAGYIKYLKDKKVQFDLWPKSLFIDKNGNRQLKDHFTLGDLQYLLELGYNRKTEEGYTKGPCSEYLKSFLKTILKDKHYDSRQPNRCFISRKFTGTRNSFIAQCEQIRDQYRNPSAHAKTVGENIAKECCEFIMGEYEAADRLNATESVLILLFEFVK